MMPGDFPHLKRILWCGEVFPTPALKYWMERLPHVAFTNLYGPTEATIASSYYTVPAPPAEPDAERTDRQGLWGRGAAHPERETCSRYRRARSARSISAVLALPSGIGATRRRPIEHFYQAGIGWTAHLSNRGPWLLGRGRAGATFSVGPTRQIKSRGHRIELGEIEAALHAVPEVGQGAIVAVEAPEFRRSRDLLCLRAPGGVQATPRAIKERMTALVPKYMLPVRWRRMETLPANANGKVDRVALAEMFHTEVRSGGGHPTSDYQ